MSTRTIQQLLDLSGKAALLTGGSRGLGLQMTHALGEAGASWGAPAEDHPIEAWDKGTSTCAATFC